MFAILRFAQEEFEDNKRVIKIRQSMKNRQHNGQKKKNKRTNNDLVNQFFKAISTDAIGFLTGAIRFIGADDSDSIPMRVLACHQGSDPGCITHSFVTTIFSMCSFFWTTIIAFNLWLPYVVTSQTDYRNIIRFTGINKSTIIFYHVINWGIPGK
jgi:hypothetical protein